jgi:glycosyltransferase involved in cell wall biosynthesis
MRVAFGLTAVRRTKNGEGVDGIGMYSLRLLDLLRASSDVSVSPFEFAAKDKLLGNLDWGNYQLQAAFSWATDATFPVAHFRLGWDIDVVHATDHFIPKISRKPLVATIHDAIPLSHPESVRYNLKQLRHAMFKHLARSATEFITVSEHSKKEIVKWFGIPEGKITVTPLGVDDDWYREVGTDELARVKAAYSLPDRFFFFVGTLQPRKNIRHIIDAHKSLPQHLRRDVPLIIAGRHGWKCDAEVAELQKCSDGTMRWIQYVPSGDMLPIFKQATALAWPSLNEGFGLPVLEAFAAGLPVITSNTTSLPEVAGDAALLVNPESIGEIAEAMQTVASNESLQNDLRTRGRARAKQFTWDRTARQTIEVYRKAIESFA